MARGIGAPRWSSTNTTCQWWPGMLGLNLKPHPRAGFSHRPGKASTIEARITGKAGSEIVATHLVLATVVKEQRGLVIRDQFSFGDVARFQKGLT
ncbi:MAG: hypothetical protein H6656_07420 [Ardenticatenaceae bacterium]|nr:hypothetical protein [Ardenticatenaceae bacterium]